MVASDCLHGVISLPETVSLLSARGFAECNPSGTRQTPFFADCYAKNTRQNNCARQTRGYAECKKTLGKEGGLPSVFLHSINNIFAECFFGTRQRNKFFFSSNLETFSTLHIQHVVLHAKIWYSSGSVCNI